MDSILKVKLIAATLLFGSWMALVCFHVEGASDIIDFIKYALGGLGFHTVYTTAKPILTTQNKDVSQ